MQIVCADLQRTFFQPQLADIQLFKLHKFRASVVALFGPDRNFGQLNHFGGMEFCHLQFIDFL